MSKKFTLILTDENDNSNATVHTENDGFNALEILGFLEMKQQDILNQLNQPAKFVRKFAGGSVEDTAEECCGDCDSCDDTDCQNTPDEEATDDIYDKVQAAYKAALEGDMDAVTGYLGEILNN